MRCSIRTEEVTQTFKLENICGLITLRDTSELLSLDEWEDAWLSL
ncbi:hypothetical protein [Shewanella sp. HN-41]|nr:hypothetical protein [Shewanella sp. HN-41]EGM68737.1 hypothetical protein SOHN41_03076 [Shewanella sp. HN-41]